MTENLTSTAPNATNTSTVSESIRTDASSIEPTSPLADATSLDALSPESPAETPSSTDAIKPGQTSTSGLSSDQAAAGADDTGFDFEHTSADTHSTGSAQATAGSAESSHSSAGLATTDPDSAIAASKSISRQANVDSLQTNQDAPDVTAGAEYQAKRLDSTDAAAAQTGSGSTSNDQNLTRNADADIMPAELLQISTAAAAAAAAADNTASPAPVIPRLPKCSVRQRPRPVPAHHASWDRGLPECDVDGIFNGWHGGQMPEHLRLALAAGQAPAPCVHDAPKKR